MSCEKCGFTVENDTKYCMNCGYSQRQSKPSILTRVKSFIVSNEATIGAPFKTTNNKVMDSHKIEAYKDEHENALSKKVSSYRDRLLQVNRKNRSIFLKKIYDKWCFDLNEYTLRNSKTNEKILECFLYGKRQLCLVPDADISENAMANAKIYP